MIHAAVRVCIYFEDPVRVEWVSKGRFLYVYPSSIIAQCVHFVVNCFLTGFGVLRLHGGSVRQWITKVGTADKNLFADGCNAEYQGVSKSSGQFS
jgi:hypothetical protein